MTTMATNVNNITKDVNELEEPSVISTDPNERKLARQLRIQRRLEALKSQESTEVENDIQNAPVEKQILASADLLEKFISEGDEVISNVRIANDAREIERRNQEKEIRKNLLKRLEDDAEECIKRYKTINEKWETIMSCKDPLDIHSEMESQNAKCLEILSMKDKVISELKDELEKADMKFVAEQKKQNEDINLLIERIDNQINTINKSYRHEIMLIENVLESERKRVLNYVVKKWDTLYEQCRKNEVDGIEMRKEIMQQYEAAMQKIMIEHHEEYRAQNISLETECQMLEQQVLQTKALCMLNMEKLNYNYAVLKRREDENIIVRNQQQRRINKFQDTINDLKKAYTDMDQSTRLEIEKLTDQVLKAHNNISELEKKSNHFAVINEKQYLDIWDMNTKSANELLEKIWNMDRIIYEQILGLQWKPPSLKLLVKENLSSYCKAVEAIEKKKTDIEEKIKECKPFEKPISVSEINQERQLLHHILQHISEKSGFFIEHEVQILLEKYSEKDKMLIKLDNVFQALDITTENEINILFNFFLPYLYCPICSEVDLIEKRTDSYLSDTSSTSTEQQNVCCPIDTNDEGTNLQDAETKLIETVIQAVNIKPCECEESSIFSEKSVQDVEENNSTNEGTNKSEKSIQSSVKYKLICDKGHLLEIQTAHVMTALKEFVDKYHEMKRITDPLTFQEQLLKKKFTISRNISAEDVTKFWTQYREIFCEKKEKLWDALFIGLQNYHKILKERYKLITEVENLKSQNSELRRLLQIYTCQINT